MVDLRPPYDIKSLLAQLPLDERIRLGGDMGTPVALSDEDCGTPFHEIAESIHEQITGA